MSADLMNLQARFRYYDFNLFKVFEQRTLQPGNESSASMAVKVQDSHDYHFVDVKPSFALPNACKGNSRRWAVSPPNRWTSRSSTAPNFLLGIAFPELLVKGKKMSYRRARRGMLIRRHDSWSQRSIGKEVSSGAAFALGGQSQNKLAPH